jgi:predicted transcriptional regulator of viral defense system
MNQRIKMILAFVAEYGSITIEDADAYFGGGYYANGRKHIGAVLSRMVRVGLLVRAGRGRYELPKQPTREDFNLRHE